MAHAVIGVGRFFCRSIRDFLNQCKFKGMDIDYIESSGWLQRDFTIKGSDKDMLIVLESLEKWASEAEK